jgi:hypothetical protein
VNRLKTRDVLQHQKTQENVERVTKMIRSNGLLTIKKISEYLNISYGFLQNILTTLFKTQLMHFTLKIHIKNTITPMKWKTNKCHYFNFIHISTDPYMFRAYRPILRKIYTAVHTTIGSVAVPFGQRAVYIYRARGLNGTATEPMVVWAAV